MARQKKDPRAEALEILHCFQLAFELTGDLRADDVVEVKAAPVAAKKRPAKAAKAGAVEGQARKRRSS